MKWFLMLCNLAMSVGVGMMVYGGDYGLAAAAAMFCLLTGFDRLRERSNGS